MKTSVRQLIAATTAAAIAGVGTLAMTVQVDAAAPSSHIAAKKASKATKYGMSGNAFGTHVELAPLGVSSNKTAYSWMGCTNRVGKGMNTALVAAELPPSGTNLLHIGAAETSTKSFRKRSADIEAGSRSTSKVANVILGDPNGLHLAIEGLATQAQVWATKKGDFKGNFDASAVKITANTGTPLDDLLNGVANPLNVLLNEITKALNGVLKLPGLGEIQISKSIVKKKKRSATSHSVALKVHLYGLDGAKFTPDDIRVRIGHSRAKIVKGTQSGVFRGRASALDATLLGGVVGTAKLADQPLGCQGTDGKWQNEGIAAVNLLGLNLVEIGAVDSGVRGLQRKNGSAEANAQGRIAGVKIGGDNGLVIEGVVSRVNVKQNKKGKIVRRDTNGSTIATIKVGGNSFSLDELLDPALTAVGGLLNQLGIGKIETMVKNRTARGMNQVAIKITLLELNNDLSLAKINLGTARARIKRK